MFYSVRKCRQFSSVGTFCSHRSDMILNPICKQPIEKAPNPLRQLKTKPSAQEFCIQTKQLENQLITKRRFILLKRPFSQIKQRFYPDETPFHNPSKEQSVNKSIKAQA